MSMLAMFNINDVSRVVLKFLLLTLNIIQALFFEQENVCLVHIEKAITFEDKIGYIMRYVVVF